MPDLFDKCFTPKLEEYAVADSMGLIPFFKVMGSEAGPTVVHEGRPVIMLGSNNYLGLTGDDRVKRAAVDAVELYGTGCTGSRLMNGTLPLHHELEGELCDWLGAEAGLAMLCSRCGPSGDCGQCDPQRIMAVWMADMQPTEPCGVVPLMVSRISRQRTGFTFLNSDVTQRSIVASASAANPLLRTTALRSSQVAVEPGGVDGWVSQRQSEAR